MNVDREEIKEDMMIVEIEEEIMIEEDMIGIRIITEKGTNIGLMIEIEEIVIEIEVIEEIEIMIEEMIEIETMTEEIGIMTELIIEVIEGIVIVIVISIVLIIVIMIVEGVTTEMMIGEDKAEIIEEMLSVIEDAEYDHQINHKFMKILKQVKNLFAF